MSGWGRREIRIENRDLILRALHSSSNSFPGTHRGTSSALAIRITVSNTMRATLLTAVNLMLFSLLHNPCSTTIYTIYKETRSAKWTFALATGASLQPIARL